MHTHPFHQIRIFESNTRIFSKRVGRKINKELAMIYLDLPEMKVCDWLWAMGIWRQSPSSVEIARNHPGLRQEYKKTLPNVHDEDIIGSPYSIYDYTPNPSICDSWDDLEEFHHCLNQAGKKLILDFVPNHLAVDTPWIERIPTAFLDRTDFYPNYQESLEKNQVLDKNDFLHTSGRIYAHGRDPYFDGWTDTVQFDFSHSTTLDLHRKFIDKISNYCDGIRCDMAMLPLSEIFERTHGKKGLAFYWEEMISATKSKKKDFLFIAEVYWNMEAELQNMGFDLTYDKDLYDHLKDKNSESLIYHLKADTRYMDHSLQFLENHDEPRAGSVFFRDNLPFFALLNFLTGGVLIHEGQINGYKKKIPVQLGRYPNEEIDKTLFNFYIRSFSVLNNRFLRTIHFLDLKFTIYNPLKCNFVFSRILIMENSSYELMVFNPYNEVLEGRIRIPDSLLEEIHPEGGDFCFYDVIQDMRFIQKRGEVQEYGLYFKLEPFHAHWMIPDNLV